MSDVSEGPGWWQASDGKWYAPELHPAYSAPSAEPTPPASTAATEGATDTCPKGHPVGPDRHICPVCGEGVFRIGDRVRVEAGREKGKTATITGTTRRLFQKVWEVELDEPGRGGRRVEHYSWTKLAKLDAGAEAVGGTFGPAVTPSAAGGVVGMFNSDSGGATRALDHELATSLLAELQDVGDRLRRMREELLKVVGTG